MTSITVHRPHCDSAMVYRHGKNPVGQERVMHRFMPLHGAGEIRLGIIGVAKHFAAALTHFFLFLGLPSFSARLAILAA